MGEVVDLELYRKRLKRKSTRAQGAGNRRNPERAAPRPDKPKPKLDPRASRFGDSGQRGPSGNTKIDPSDPKRD